MKARRPLAERILDRALGPERAASVLGDLEEDLARPGRPGAPLRRLRGLWLLRQALGYAVAVHWNDRWSPTRFDLPGDPPPGPRRSPELTIMLHDVRNAIRSLRAAPAFTVVALLVLTLGIGASTAIFSVVDAVVLRNLPYEDPDRLVQVTMMGEQAGSYRTAHTPQDFVDFRERQDFLSGLAAVASASGFTITEDETPEDLRTLRVTADYFEVFRARPQLGRPFTAENEIEGNHFVALISDGLWRRRFGADPDIVGRRLRFPDGTWDVIGVMPRGFRSPISSANQTELWVPYFVPETQRERGNSRSSYLQVTGRLKDGVTIDQADARMQALVAGLIEEHPSWFGKQIGAVRSLHESVVGRVRSWMYMLLGAVAVVLLIACVNVANLMLARATARNREIQVRAALGASRWQIARGLLVESVVLSAAGTLCALLLAFWGVDVLRAALPNGLPRGSTIALDLRVLMAAACAALVTGLLFGLAPALQFSRPNLSAALRDGGRGTAGGRQRLRSALVVVEVALAVVLVVGSGLFVSSFVRLTSVDIGLDHHNVLTMAVWPRIDSSKPGWVEPAQERAAVAIPEIVARVQAIPGVEAAGFISGGLPLSGSWSRTGVRVPGREEPFEGDDSVDLRQVTPDYGRAIGTALRRGRYLLETDTAGSAKVVVLNEEAARRYLDGRDPLGATLTVGNVERTVVGIVGDVRLGGPERAVRPEAYVPITQAGILGGDLAIRTHGDPVAIAEQVRAAIWATFPDLAAPPAETMDSLLQGHIAQRQFNMMLVGIFGVLAIAIAAAGIYGVMGYIVSQRTQEIGVRMALGAVPSSVLAMILGRAAIFMVLGLAIGLAAAWQLASSIEAFLFEVQPHDTVVYVSAAAVLLAVGLLAAFVPARRAARVDPLVALREA